MAARNEEQCQTELRKWQDYSSFHSSFPIKGKHNDKTTKDMLHKPNQHSRTPASSNSSQASSGVGNNTARCQQRCYLCNQLGHIATYCKQSKSKGKESTGNSNQKSTSVYLRR